jgi:hypothetical protein
VRPQDNVALGMHEPQENEFAIVNMTGLSSYYSWVFPRRAAHYDRYLTFHDASAEDLGCWQAALHYFVQKVTYGYRRPWWSSRPATPIRQFCAASTTVKQGQQREAAVTALGHACDEDGVPVNSASELIAWSIPRRRQVPITQFPRAPNTERVRRPDAQHKQRRRQILAADCRAMLSLLSPPPEAVGHTQLCDGHRPHPMSDARESRYPTRAASTGEP